MKKIRYIEEQIAFALKQAEPAISWEKPAEIWGFLRPAQKRQAVHFCRMFTA